MADVVAEHATPLPSRRPATGSDRLARGRRSALMTWPSAGLFVAVLGTLIVFLLVVLTVALLRPDDSDDDDGFFEQREAEAAKERPRVEPLDFAQTALPTIEPWYTAFDGEQAATRPALSFHLVWTTGLERFGERQLAVLDSILFHHPTARVTVHSNELAKRQPAYFARYTDAGYQLHVVGYSLDTLLALAPAELAGTVDVWLERHWPCLGDADAQQQQECGYAYSHLTDYMRFALLHRHGGSYADFDALLLRPVDDLVNAVGRDLTGEPDQSCPWCLDDNVSYLAPGLLINWQRGHPLLLEAMRLAFDVRVYDRRCFNCAGPRALTVAYTNTRSARDAALSSLPVPVRRLRAADVRVLLPDCVYVLEPYQLYPIRWNDVERHAQPATDSAARWDNLRQLCTSVHLYGHVSATVDIHPRSVLGLALAAHRLFYSSEQRRPQQQQQQPYALRLPDSIFLSASATTNVLAGVRLTLSVDHRRAMLGVQTLELTVSAARQSLAVATAATAAAKSVTLRGTPLELNTALAALVFVHPEHTSARHSADLSLAEPELLVFDVSDPARNFRHAVAVYELHNFVTVVAKTLDRPDALARLVRSVRVAYPSLSVVVADDGMHAERTAAALAHDSGVRVLDVGFDAGLSFCRNRLVEQVRTPFVLVIDDDFTLQLDSNVPRLLANAVQHDYDIVAGKNPVDKLSYDIDFCGLMQLDRDARALLMTHGDHGHSGDCLVVDFVPNLFLARTESLLRVKWDDRLKLGEHEDFFYRAKLAGLKVGTCPTIAFHHHSSPFWLRRGWYDRMRQRVYTFFAVVARKFDIDRIVLFDQTIFDATTANIDVGDDDDQPVCAVGTTGPRCDVCLPGFGGRYCSECLPGHYGPACTPCVCRFGSCDEGFEGTGRCRCWDSDSEADDNGEDQDVECKRLAPGRLVSGVIFFLFVAFAVVSFAFIVRQRLERRQQSIPKKS